MADKTGIQWTDATWNPIRGCSVVSGGCKNCYAMRTARRHSGPGRPYEGLTELRSGKPMWNGKIRLVPELLDQPLRWTKPRRVFVNSMSDLFHEAVPDEFVMAVMGVMAACPQHVFQILTKRPERMVRLMGEDQWPLMQCAGAADKIMRPSATIARKLYAHFDDVMGESDLDGPPLPNVWLGLSVEDQATADERIPLLLRCPAARHWAVVREGVRLDSLPANLGALPGRDGCWDWFDALTGIGEGPNEYYSEGQVFPKLDFVERP